MNIALSLNGDSSSIDVIKYCALYFDSITIDMPVYFHTFEKIKTGKSKKHNKLRVRFLPLFDRTLLQHTKMLEDEGIVKYAIPSAELPVSEETIKIDHSAMNFVLSNIYKLFQGTEVSTLKEENEKNI